MRREVELGRKGRWMRNGGEREGEGGSERWKGRWQLKCEARVGVNGGEVVGHRKWEVRWKDRRKAREVEKANRRRI